MEGSFWKSAEFEIVDTEADYPIRQHSYPADTRAGAPSTSLRAGPRHTRSKGVQVGEQVSDLLIGHNPAEAFHLAAAVFDDLADAVVIRRQPA